MERTQFRQDLAARINNFKQAVADDAGEWVIKVSITGVAPIDSGSTDIALSEDAEFSDDDEQNV